MGGFTFTFEQEGVWSRYLKKNPLLEESEPQWGGELCVVDTDLTGTGDQLVQ